MDWLVRRMYWLVRRVSRVPVGGRRLKPVKGETQEIWLRRWAAWLIVRLPEKLALRLLHDFDL